MQETGVRTACLTIEQAAQAGELSIADTLMQLREQGSLQAQLIPAHVPGGKKILT